MPAEVNIDTTVTMMDVAEGTGYEADMIRPSLPVIIGLGLLPATLAAQTALPVEIVTVSAQPRTEEHRLIGKVEAANTYPGAFRSGGRIVEIGVETGDRVAAGAVIARIDAAQAQAAQTGARASLEAAEAALRLAELARDRATSLLARGVGTQSQLDAADEAFLAARAQRDQAAAQLASAEQALEDTVIRASENLIVIDRLAQPGEIAGAGQEIVTLASEGRRDAVFLSPDMTGLAELRGMQIELRPADHAPIVTTLTEIAPVLTATGTVEVRAVIPPGAAAALTIGNTVEGRISRQTDPVFTVPWTALTATSSGPAVWTVDPASMAVRLTPITIETYADTTVGISAGLRDGALVVGAGSQVLYEGMVVKQAGANQ